MIAKKNALPLSLQTIYKDLSDKNKTEIREAFNKQFGFSEESKGFFYKMNGSHAVSYQEFYFLEEILNRYQLFEATINSNYTPAIQVA